MGLTFDDLGKMVDAYDPPSSLACDVSLAATIWCQLAGCTMQSIDEEQAAGLAIAKQIDGSDSSEQARRSALGLLSRRMDDLMRRKPFDKRAEAINRLVWAGLLRDQGVTPKLLDLMLEVSEDAGVEPTDVQRIFSCNLPSFPRG